MDERFERLLRRQIEDGFTDLRGTEAAITLPVSERLLNEVLGQSIPASAPVTDVHVAPEPGDRFTIRFRLGSSSFLPRLKISLAIVRQPELPSLPVLVLRLETTGLMMVATPVLRFLNALPAGVSLKHDQIHVDLRALAEQRGFGAYFEYLEELRVHTVNAAVILTTRGRIR